MEKAKVSSFVVVSAVLLLLIGAVVVLNLNKPLITNTPNNIMVALTDLNNSDDSTFGVNPDDTMGPGSSNGNYSNRLPNSVKGNLAFYVTDPPGNPPGLEKKNLPITATENITLNPLFPTQSENKGKAVTVTNGAPTTGSFLPGKNAQLTALLLTITKVEVHRSGSLSSVFPTVTPTVTPTGQESRWETLDIGATPKTVDMFDLANKKLDLLFGTTKLQDGHYTEVRLYVSSALAKYSDGGQANLQILGKKNIVKIVRQFTIVAGQTTKLTVDFNAPRSVVRAGKKFLLKPVVARFIVE